MEVSPGILEISFIPFLEDCQLGTKNNLYLNNNFSTKRPIFKLKSSLRI
jgi:hypothetical protein